VWTLLDVGRDSVLDVGRDSVLEPTLYPANEQNE
jgi:hypothetical protein